MKYFIYMILFLSGISFAVTAKDFPCFSTPNKFRECWTFVKDPRDSQVYLAVKHCGINWHDSTACVVYYNENSRYKSPNAKCGEGDDFYYGCVYPAKEVEKYACPDFNVETHTHYYFDGMPQYSVTAKEYAKLRRKIIQKRNVEIRNMFFYKENDNIAATPGGTVWLKYNGKWGETSLPQKKEVYWACAFFMPDE